MVREKHIYAYFMNDRTSTLLKDTSSFLLSFIFKYMLKDFQRQINSKKSLKNCGDIGGKLKYEVIVIFETLRFFCILFFISDYLSLL